MVDTTSTVPVISGGSTVFQQNVTLDPSANVTPQSVPRVNGSPVATDNPMPTADANGAAFQGTYPFTGTGNTLTATPGRSLGYVCSASGTITVTFPDATAIPVPISAGAAFQSLPFAATQIVLSNGTAGMFWNMK